MKKLDLGGIKTATEPKAVHPTVDIDDNEMQTLLDQWARISPQAKSFANQAKTLSLQLAPRIKALFFSTFSGIESASTMLVRAGTGTIKLITKNQYSQGLDNSEELEAAIGKELTDRYFRHATVLKLDLNECPEDKQEEFATAVIELANALGVSGCITAKQCIQPKPGFHEARTSLLTPEQNAALDKLMPVVAFPML